MYVGGEVNRTATRSSTGTLRRVSVRILSSLPVAKEQSPTLSLPVHNGTSQAPTECSVDQDWDTVLFWGSVVLHYQSLSCRVSQSNTLKTTTAILNVLYRRFRALGEIGLEVYVYREQLPVP